MEEEQDLCGEQRLIDSDEHLSESGLDYEDIGGGCRIYNSSYKLEQVRLEDGQCHEDSETESSAKPPPPTYVEDGTVFSESTYKRMVAIVLLIVSLAVLQSISFFPVPTPFNEMPLAPIWPLVHWPNDSQSTDIEMNFLLQSSDITSLSRVYDLSNVQLMCPASAHPLPAHGDTSLAIVHDFGFDMCKDVISTDTVNVPSFLRSPITLEPLEFTPHFVPQQITFTALALVLPHESVMWDPRVAARTRVNWGHHPMCPIPSKVVQKCGHLVSNDRFVSAYVTNHWKVSLRPKGTITWHGDTHSDKDMFVDMIVMISTCVMKLSLLIARLVSNMSVFVARVLHPEFHEANTTVTFHYDVYREMYSLTGISLVTSFQEYPRFVSEFISSAIHVAHIALGILFICGGKRVLSLLCGSTIETDQDKGPSSTYSHLQESIHVEPVSKKHCSVIESQENQSKELEIDVECMTTEVSCVVEDIAEHEVPENTSLGGINMSSPSQSRQITTKAMKTKNDTAECFIEDIDPTTSCLNEQNPEETSEVKVQTPTETAEMPAKSISTDDVIGSPGAEDAGNVSNTAQGIAEGPSVDTEQQNIAEYSTTKGDGGERSDTWQLTSEECAGDTKQLTTTGGTSDTAKMTSESHAVEVVQLATEKNAGYTSDSGQLNTEKDAGKASDVAQTINENDASNTVQLSNKRNLSDSKQLTEKVTEGACDIAQLKNGSHAEQPSVGDTGNIGQLITEKDTSDTAQMINGNDTGLSNQKNASDTEQLTTENVIGEAYDIAQLTNGSLAEDTSDGLQLATEKDTGDTHQLSSEKDLVNTSNVTKLLNTGDPTDTLQLGNHEQVTIETVTGEACDIAQLTSGSHTREALDGVQLVTEKGILDTGQWGIEKDAVKSTNTPQLINVNDTGDPSDTTGLGQLNNTQDTSAGHDTEQKPVQEYKKHLQGEKDVQETLTGQQWNLKCNEQPQRELESRELGNTRDTSAGHDTEQKLVQQWNLECNEQPQRELGSGNTRDTSAGHDTEQKPVQEYKKHLQGEKDVQEKMTGQQLNLECNEQSQRELGSRELGNTSAGHDTEQKLVQEYKKQLQGEKGALTGQQWNLKCKEQSQRELGSGELRNTRDTSAGHDTEQKPIQEYKKRLQGEKDVQETLTKGTGQQWNLECKEQSQRELGSGELRNTRDTSAGHDTEQKPVQEYKKHLQGEKDVQEKMTGQQLNLECNEQSQRELGSRELGNTSAGHDTEQKLVQEYKKQLQGEKGALTGQQWNLECKEQSQRELGSGELRNTRDTSAGHDTEQKPIQEYKKRLQGEKNVQETLTKGTGQQWNLECKEQSQRELESGELRNTRDTSAGHDTEQKPVQEYKKHLQGEKDVQEKMTGQQLNLECNEQSQRELGSRELGNTSAGHDTEQKLVQEYKKQLQGEKGALTGQQWNLECKEQSQRELGSGELRNTRDTSAGHDTEQKPIQEYKKRLQGEKNVQETLTKGTGQQWNLECKEQSQRELGSGELRNTRDTSAGHDTEQKPIQEYKKRLQGEKDVQETLTKDTGQQWNLECNEEPQRELESGELRNTRDTSAGHDTDQKPVQEYKKQLQGEKGALTGQQWNLECNEQPQRELESRELGNTRDTSAGHDTDQKPVQEYKKQLQGEKGALIGQQWNLECKEESLGKHFQCRTHQHEKCRGRSKYKDKHQNLPVDTGQHAIKQEIRDHEVTMQVHNSFVSVMKIVLELCGYQPQLTQHRGSSLQLHPWSSEYLATNNVKPFHNHMDSVPNELCGYQFSHIDNQIPPTIPLSSFGLTHVDHVGVVSSHLKPFISLIQSSAECTENEGPRPPRQNQAPVEWTENEGPPRQNQAPVECTENEGRPRQNQAPVEWNENEGPPRQNQAPVECTENEGRPKQNQAPVKCTENEGPPRQNQAPVECTENEGRPRQNQAPVECTENEGRPRQNQAPVECTENEGRPRQNQAPVECTENEGPPRQNQAPVECTENEGRPRQNQVPVEWNENEGRPKQNQAPVKCTENEGPPRQNQAPVECTENEGRPRQNQAPVECTENEGPPRQNQAPVEWTENEGHPRQNQATVEGTENEGCPRQDQIPVKCTGNEGPPGQNEAPVEWTENEGCPRQNQAPVECTENEGHPRQNQAPENEGCPRQIQAPVEWTENEGPPGQNQAPVEWNENEGRPRQNQAPVECTEKEGPPGQNQAPVECTENEGPPGQNQAPVECTENEGPPGQNQAPVECTENEEVPRHNQAPVKCIENEGPSPNPSPADCSGSQEFLNEFPEKYQEYTECTKGKGAVEECPALEESTQNQVSSKESLEEYRAPAQ